MKKMQSFGWNEDMFKRIYYLDHSNFLTFANHEQFSVAIPVQSQNNYIHSIKNSNTNKIIVIKVW